MTNYANALLACSALCMLCSPSAQAASTTYTLGKKGAIEAVSVFSGDASGNSKGVEGSVSTVLRLKIASKDYDVMGLESEAELAGVGKGTAVVKGEVFGVKRIFLKYPDKESEDKKGKIGFPYYATDFNLPQARFLVGVVPFKLQPNVTLKIDGTVKSEITRSADGGGKASLTFQPIRATAEVGFDFGVGVKVVEAALRGEVTLGLSANINGSYFKKSDCSGGGSYRVFGGIDGPEGKVSFVAEFETGIGKKKKYEVEKELWKLPNPKNDEDNNVDFVLTKGEFDFSNLYDFKSEVVAVSNGALYQLKRGDGSIPTMQSIREDFVGQTFEESMPICVDWDDPNPSFILDEVVHKISGSGTIRQITAFDKTPREVVQSGGGVIYYGVWTLKGQGTFNTKTGEIRLTYEDVFDLSWNLSGAVSTSRVKEVWVGKPQPPPAP